MPLVFAGAELGLEGPGGQDARRTMPWDDPAHWDDVLLGELPAADRAAPLERRAGAGRLPLVHVADDVHRLPARDAAASALLCLAARAPHEPIAVPFAELETLYGDDARDGVLPSDGPAFHVWRIG